MPVDKRAPYIQDKRQPQPLPRTRTTEYYFHEHHLRRHQQLHDPQDLQHQNYQIVLLLMNALVFVSGWTVLSRPLAL
jgi:hypothetical protein